MRTSVAPVMRMSAQVREIAPEHRARLLYDARLQSALPGIVTGAEQRNYRQKCCDGAVDMGADSQSASPPFSGGTPPEARDHLTVGATPLK